MALSDLDLADGAGVGAWISPRLEGGFGGKVEQLVPNGYDGYVRVFHPAADADGNPVTWARAAEEKRRIAHREMQWHRLMGVAEPNDAHAAWSGEVPPIGELDAPTLKALCAILEAHTAEPRNCFFGLSTIHGGVDSAYPDAVQLRWPNRDFVVFAGPLSAADQVGYESSNYGRIALVDGRWQQVPPTPRWFSQAPNLIWPADRSWFVQSEYDLDSTLVGGSRQLVDSLLDSAELETWEVQRGDSLEAWADRIN
jgi:hypothetical protein